MVLNHNQDGERAKSLDVWAKLSSAILSVKSISSGFGKISESFQCCQVHARNNSWNEQTVRNSDMIGVEIDHRITNDGRASILVTEETTCINQGGV
jgi:hypothetical protein